MNTSTNTLGVSPIDGQSTAHDFFALTDEQILEIEPEAQDVEIGASQTASGDAPKENPSTSETQSASHDQSTSAPARVGVSARDERKGDGVPAAQPPHGSGQAGLAVPQEPPAWVADAMNDPQRGKEAQAFWEGAQKAQQEASAYREVFAKPEEARAAAERARLLDDIDRAYFAGDTNQRAQLATAMLREDPAAFREMVFAGLRALEAAGAALPDTARTKNVAQAFRPEGVSSQEVSPDRKSLTPEGVSYRNDGAHDAQVTAYAAFERATNEDLERSVGSAIERTIQQALPNIAKADRGSAAGAQQAAPLQARLQSAIRQEVEKALQGDRQLGEQIGQILSARRFDGETRAQVVRLIDERAKQLVPGAAKRVLQDWTQTTLAAHRSRTRQNDTAAARSDLTPANSEGKTPRQQAVDNSRSPARNDNKSGKSAKVDYRKLSDEQILEM